MVINKKKHTGTVQFVKKLGYVLDEREIGVRFPAETGVSYALQRSKRF
jgi:hypothetical protein